VQYGKDVDSTIFKNSGKFPDGALYKAKLHTFEDLDFNFNAQASVLVKAVLCYINISKFYFF
jgi:hypothetical protein